MSKEKRMSFDEFKAALRDPSTAYSKKTETPPVEERSMSSSATTKKIPAMPVMPKHKREIYPTRQLGVDTHANPKPKTRGLDNPQTYIATEEGEVVDLTDAHEKYMRSDKFTRKMVSGAVTNDQFENGIGFKTTPKIHQQVESTGSSPIEVEKLKVKDNSDLYSDSSSTIQIKQEPNLYLIDLDKLQVSEEILNHILSCGRKFHTKPREEKTAYRRNTNRAPASPSQPAPVPVAYKPKRREHETRDGQAPWRRNARTTRCVASQGRWKGVGE